MELLALQPGGSGRRPRDQGLGNETQWRLCEEITGNDDDESWSSNSSYGSSSEDDDDLASFEEEEETESCLTDLVGNRILPVGKIAKIFREVVCCKKCAVRNHKSYMKDFLDFCQQHKADVAQEERRQLFHLRTQRLEWRLEQMRPTSELYQMFTGGRQEKTIEDQICCNFHVSEETWGVATALYGRCKRERKPHCFSVDAVQISKGPVKDALHPNSRTAKYSINHQLCAAIQQMGCGATGVKMLTGFLDLPSSGKIDKHVAVVEKTLGSVQERMREESQKDALQEEIALMKAHNDLEFHECSVEGHEHGPLPKVKGSYGKQQ